MKEMKALAVLSMLAVTTQAYSYDVVDRFKLIDDKLKTEEMLNPIGHDFFLDMGVSLNKNAKDVITEISDVSKVPAASQLNEAQRILTKYEKTEQTVKIRAAFGFPIFSFSAWNLKVQPNVRAFVNAGANLGIRTDQLTVQDIIDLFPTGLPDQYIQEFVTWLATPGNVNAGEDIIVKCKASAMSVIVRGFCQQEAEGKYIMPNLNVGVPNVAVYAKVDAKVGFFNDYTYGDHFFGDFDLYALNRTDIFQRITKNMIAAGSKIELPKKKNSETTLQADYRLGYKNDNYRVSASIEEMKLSKMKERDEGSKELSYGYDPLMRLHADANYRFSALLVNPFLGVHKRKGYGFSDGVYAGTDLGAYVWGDRLGLQLRGMVDKQYYTISPRMKLWLMSLEYSMKAPMKSMDGDTKLSALHSIDLRLFF